jgi:dihydrolipoamide dehydrogenase
LQKNLEKQGIKVHTGVKVESVSGSGGTVTVVFSSEGGKGDVSADVLMAATGRKAYAEGLGLETAGITVDKGAVPVDNTMRTNIPGVYAIGDVTGQWQLAHAASAMGLIAVDRITGRKNYTNMDVVPACVYTRPELSSVGLTEEEAARKGYAIETGLFRFAGNSKAVIAGETDGFVKIVADEETGAILGGHLIGPEATDLVAEIALAIQSELTIEEIGSTIHPHPTISEAVMEAVHDVEGLSVHKPMSRRKG